VTGSASSAAFETASVPIALDRGRACLLWGVPDVSWGNGDRLCASDGRKGEARGRLSRERQHFGSRLWRLHSRRTSRSRSGLYRY
jgi:hypothetical protein